MSDREISVGSPSSAAEHASRISSHLRSVVTMNMSFGRADWFPAEIGSPFVSDDEQMLRAAVAGDAQALTTFVRDTQQHVWRFCAYLGRGADVDDLVQETY